LNFKMPPPLRVEWKSDVANWMLDAAVAFDACMHQCTPPDNCDSEDPIVVHIAVFRESDRPLGCAGEQLKPVPPEEMEIVAQPMVRRLKNQPLLSTRVGGWLARHKRRGKIIALIVVCISVLHVLDPGAETRKVQDPSDRDHLIDVRKQHPAVAMTLLALIAASLLLLAHDTSRSLLKLSVSFDALVIAGSAVMCVIAAVYETVQYAPVEMELDHFDVALLVMKGVATVMAHSSIGVVDAWTVAPRIKQLVTLFFTIAALVTYMIQRYLVSWSKHQMCDLYFQATCVTWQDVFLSALSNEIVFGIKLCVPFWYRRTYGLLTSYSIDPQRECYRGGRVCHHREGLFDQSHRFSTRHTLDTSTYKVDPVDADGHTPYVANITSDTWSDSFSI